MELSLKPIKLAKFNISDLIGSCKDSTNQRPEILHVNCLRVFINHMEPDRAGPGPFRGLFLPLKHLFEVIKGLLG